MAAQEDQTRIGDIHRSDGYIIPTRIMVTAVSVLALVIVLIVCLHVYARCCLLGHHRPAHAHQPRRARRRRVTRLRLRVVVTSDDGPNVVQTAPAHAHARGLDEATRRSIPVFVFSSEGSAGGEKGMDCAVCLSEFEEKEKGRLLPNCKHCFHTDCIDMWLLSHSTCPLCRAPVFEHNAVVSETTASSVVEVAISPDVAPVNENGNTESSRITLIENETDSPSSSSSSQLDTSISSTGAGFLSLKRILNREVVLLSPRGLGRSSAVEFDIERGPSPKAST